VAPRAAQAAQAAQQSIAGPGPEGKSNSTGAVQ
jgi:hypothetical protein